MRPLRSMAFCQTVSFSNLKLMLYSYLSSVDRRLWTQHHLPPQNGPGGHTTHGRPLCRERRPGPPGRALQVSCQRGDCPCAVILVENPPRKNCTRMGPATIIIAEPKLRISGKSIFIGACWANRSAQW